MAGALGCVLLAVFIIQMSVSQEGEDFLHEKATSKDSQGFQPNHNKPYGGNSSQSSNQSFSSEGSKTSEAPGVVFDPTIGEGGVENPLPNDSSKASISPPVGGRLCFL